MTHFRIRRSCSALLLTASAALALTVSLAGQDRPAAVPSAPSGLTYNVDGSNVAMQWTAPTGAFTEYVLEAGSSPGTTFFQFPTSLIANPSTLAQLLPNLNASAPPGNYYVRVRAANAEGVGAASNEILIPITGGCQAPGAPTELGAIVRGTFGLIQWNAGSGGQPTSYVLQARFAPTGPVIAAIQITDRFLNVAGIPNGTYYVEVIALTACGQSAPSNQIVVVAPSSTPARTPNPAPGARVPLPYVADIIAAAARERPDLFPGQSCSNPDAEYILNPFLNFLIDRLRTFDLRFGYNSKPTRGPSQNGGQPVVAAGDEIAYHYGSDAPEGSPNTYAIDVIFSHCLRPEIYWRNFTGGEFARWTGAGRF